MKISKLFHWLYAFLMFLPVTFLLPSLLYFGFNDNATAQEYTKEEVVYYQTNDVDSVDDLVTGNVYTFACSSLYSSNVQWVQVSEYLDIVGTSTGSGTGALHRTTAPYLMVQGNDVYPVEGDYSYLAYHSVSIDFIFNEEYSEDTSTIILYITSCPRLYEKEVISYTYTMGITESINQSILDTFDLPMFSWTSDNFLIAPFNYITNLFGLPNGNVVNKYLDYWLSISIIYLCFDVIMYVPLLVHRWLDKGIVE